MFKPNPLPSVYRYPSYLVMYASMINRVIDEGNMLPRTHIPQDYYVWVTQFKSRRREINVALDVIKSRQVRLYMLPSILKVLKNNELSKVILYTNSKIKSEDL